MKWWGYGLLFALALVFAAEPARCFYCPNFPCWSSQSCGGYGCLCMGGAPGAPGACVYVR